MIVKERAMESGEYGTQTQDIVTSKRQEDEKNRTGNTDQVRKAEVWKVLFTKAKECHKYLSSTNFALHITNKYKTALPFKYICSFSLL